MKHILRPKEVAKYLSLSLPTVWRLIKKGDFPPKIQLSAKAVGFSEAAVIEWLNKRGTTSSLPTGGKND